MCLDDQILSEYIDNELIEPWKSQVIEHLNWCEACRSRYEKIKSVNESIGEAALDDDSIKYAQKRIMRYLESNVMDKPEHKYIRRIKDFFKNRIVMPICATIITFCFCMIVFNHLADNNIPMNTTTQISTDRVIPVRASDNHTTSKTLRDYSLEDIIKHLDESGYDVTISPKVLTPIKSPSDEEKTISPHTDILSTGRFKFIPGLRD